MYFNRLMRSVYQMCKLLLPFTRDGVVGFCSIEGREVVRPRYRSGWESTEGVAVAKRHDDTFVLLDFSGEEICELRNFNAHGCGFYHGLMEGRDPRREIESCGYVDQQGQWAIEPRFAWASDFDRHGAIVKIRQSEMSERRIDHHGQFMGQPYLSIRQFHPDGDACGATIAWSSPGMVVINGQGELLNEDVYDTVWQEHEGFIPVRYHRDGVIGWLNSAGDPLVEFPGKAIGNHFESGLVPVQVENDKWGLMNSHQEWVLEAEFDVVESVGDNRFMVGQLDDEGEAPIVRLADGCGNFFGTHEYEAISRFREGIARVWRPKQMPKYEWQSEFNFIDMDGRLMLPTWA